jgi:hypothetical protein
MVEIASPSYHDADELARLARETYTEALGASMAPSDLARHLEKHLSGTLMDWMLAVDEFLVARDEGSILGFVQFGQVHDRQDSSYRPPPRHT